MPIRSEYEIWRDELAKKDRRSNFFAWAIPAVGFIGLIVLFALLWPRA